MDAQPVDYPEEELVAHQDGHQQVPEHQCAKVVLGVRELSAGGKNDARGVEGHNEREELAVRVEPQAEPDLPADLWLRLCRSRVLWRRRLRRRSKSLWP